LANESDFTREQGTGLLVKSVSLAVEAASRADRLGVRILEADSALRNGLGLPPRSHGRLTMKGRIFHDNIIWEATAISPNGEYVAALMSSPYVEGVILSVRRTSDMEEIYRGPCAYCRGIALSSDGRRNGS
jgi:hypothetical protein